MLEVLVGPFRSVSFCAIVFIQVVLKAATSTRSAFCVRIFDFPINNIAFLHKRKQERQLLEVDKLLSMNGRKIPIFQEFRKNATMKYEQGYPTEVRMRTAVSHMIMLSDLPIQEGPCQFGVKIYM